MSGGSYNYIYNTLSEECEGYMHDEEMNTLIKDLCKVLHDLEWWQSCDISEENYRKTVTEFKEKWFHSTENKREWIPVTKRLPDDGKWAIFTDGSTISVERFKTDALDHFYPQGRWFSFDNAIAWMPIPEPDKAESEET